MSEQGTALCRLAREFIPAHTLANMPPDTPILVALSGGADSSLLLSLCASYAKEHPHKIYAAHVNHCIRGEDADADEKFCARLCEKLGVEFFSLRADVPNIAKESGESVEGAARRIRYDFFAKIMRENSIPLLVTAHNADDNLETQIFNLARGSGLTGLSGIPRVRECEGGTLVRPILDIPKREVLSLCQEYGIDFVTDKTNSDTDYSRNRIRALIIPELEKLTSSPQRAALRCADALREDEKFLASLSEDFVQKNSVADGLDARALAEAPKPIRFRAIKILASRAGLSSLEAVHYDAVSELAKRAEPHSSIDLGQGFCASVERSALFIRKRKEGACEDFYFERELTQGVTVSDKGRFLLLVERKEGNIFTENSNKFKNVYNLYTEIYLNSATIKGCPLFRTRKDSDVILSHGMHKKLRKLFGEKSIHPELRARIPLLCDADGILWAPFCALRDGAKHKQSECDLKISLFINDFD